jgi:carbamoyltransferase
MIKWGINALGHDASLSVFHNDKCVFASHSERFSRFKNEAFLEEKLLHYALEYGVPNEIIWSEKPFLKFLRQIKTLDFRAFGMSPKKYLSNIELNYPTKYILHHESHAAGAAYTCDFDKSLVFVFDSIGEFDTITVWLKDNLDLKLIYSQKYPNSLGLFYSAFTRQLGLNPNEEEFILMGMAGYGKPIYKDQIIERFFDIRDPEIKLKYNFHMGVNFEYENKFDLAASVQAVYEELTLNFCNYFKKRYNINNACFSGGCALNCMANSKYLEIFEKVWVFPNSGDAGNSYGAVLADIKKNHVYDPFIGFDIKKEIDVDNIVKKLLEGEVVAIANGKAEFGPRALGNRSILADPRIENIQDKVNKIKYREQFRPFAPSILEENFKDVFESSVDKSPYMNLIFKNKYPNEFKGITHVDGTSRVQTVSEKENTILRKILIEWKAKTGIPLLLNTSLNIKGMPLVNSEEDAIEFKKFHQIRIY